MTGHIGGRGVLVNILQEGRLETQVCIDSRKNLNSLVRLLFLCSAHLTDGHLVIPGHIHGQGVLVNFLQEGRLDTQGCIDSRKNLISLVRSLFLCSAHLTDGHPAISGHIHGQDVRVNILQGGRLDTQ